MTNEQLLVPHTSSLTDGLLRAQSVEAFQDLQLKANLEYWIEPLKDITFDTALAPISVGLLISLPFASRFFFCLPQSSLVSLSFSHISLMFRMQVADAHLLIRCYEHYDEGAGRDDAALPEADAEALAALEATLAACMASLNAGEGARFFVKDSSRGPKDFGLISDEFVAQYIPTPRNRSSQRTHQIAPDAEFISDRLLPRSTMRLQLSRKEGLK